MSQLIYNSHNQLQLDVTWSKQISHTILVEIPFYQTLQKFTNIIINLFCFTKPTNIIFIPYSNDSEIQWIKMIIVNSIFNFNIYLIRRIQFLINYMYSIALPIDLTMFLAFCKARNLSPEALSAKCSISNSVWGNLSRIFSAGIGPI